MKSNNPITNSHKNSGKRFSEKEDEIIKSSIKKNATVKSVAYRLRRTTDSVVRRARKITNMSFTR